MGSIRKSLSFERDFERLLGCPAYRATLLYFYFVTHEVMRDKHEFLL